MPSPKFRLPQRTGSKPTGRPLEKTSNRQRVDTTLDGLMNFSSDDHAFELPKGTEFPLVFRTEAELQAFITRTIKGPCLELRDTLTPVRNFLIGGTKKRYRQPSNP